MILEFPMWPKHDKNPPVCSFSHHTLSTPTCPRRTQRRGAPSNIILAIFLENDTAIVSSGGSEALGIFVFSSCCCHFVPFLIPLPPFSVCLGRSGLVFSSSFPRCEYSRPAAFHPRSMGRGLHLNPPFLLSFPAPPYLSPFPFMSSPARHVSSINASPSPPQCRLSALKKSWLAGGWKSAGRAKTGFICMLFGLVVPRRGLCGGDGGLVLLRRLWQWRWRWEDG